MKKDFISSVICILLGFFLWITLPIFISHDDQLTPMGPRFFPSFLSLMLIVLGVVLFVKSWKWRYTIPKNTEGNKVSVTKRDELKVLILYGIMIVSCVLFTFFRYLVAMIVSATAMLALYNVKKWQAYIILYFFIIIFYFLFSKLIYVQL